MAKLDSSRKLLVSKLGELLGGLCEWPDDYNAHPIADAAFVDGLVEEEIRIPIPPELKPEGDGGFDSLKGFALLTLDSLELRLSKSGRDQSLKYNEKTKRYEKLTRGEQVIIGLIASWIRYYLPVLEVDQCLDKPADFGKVIDVGRSLPVMTRLMQRIYQDVSSYKRHLSWIPDVFAQLHDKGDGGERRAGLYCGSALDFILQRIERVAAKLDLTIEELLQQPDDDSTHVAQASVPVPEVVLDWNTRLSQCVADYRRYELSQLKQWLDQRGLPPLADWFQIRRVYHRADRFEQGRETPLVFLEDICKPGLRTALMDQRGSGTTTALLWLSSRYCENPTNIEPVVLRLDARDYRRCAAGQSPYEYLAREIYGSDRGSLAKREEFESVLRETETVCLIDNLARLGPDDQRVIARQLWSFSGLILTAEIGASDEFLIEIGGEGTMRAELAPLENVQIQLLIAQFADRYDSRFDRLLARHIALRELPQTARFPLGLNVICEQVLWHRSDCASIVGRFIGELLGSDGLPLLQWDELSRVFPGIRALAMLAWRMHPSRTGQEMGEGVPSEIDEEWAQRYLEGRRLLEHWSEARASPLLVPTGPGTYRFLNQEVFGFLVAVEDSAAADRCGWWSLSNIFGPDTIEVTNRHYF
ncbi:MAG: hypothetical protein IMY86_11635, partial [Chloroflexi bacterium]|nr:hypothetical protein [Chloroflexota bacterium]